MLFRSLIPVLSLNFSPLRPVSGCSQLPVFLTVLTVPSHQLGMLFLNSRFNRGIIGAYHITFAGTLFLGGSPSTSPGSSRLIYRNAPHTGHAFRSLYAPRKRMQSLGHACIFCTCNPRGHTTFFAAYIPSGNLLSFGSFFFNIFSSF